MAGRTTYTVTCPLVIAHTPDGDQYRSEGSVLPDNIDQVQLEQLIESDLVVKGEYVPEAPKAPESDADASDAKSAKAGK